MSKKKKMRIELASQEKIEKLGFYTDQLLLAMGHPEALVTDESTIWDFYFLDDDEEVEKLSRKIGVPVTKKDYLVDVARKMLEADIQSDREDDEAQ